VRDAVVAWADESGPEAARLAPRDGDDVTALLEAGGRRRVHLAGA